MTASSFTVADVRRAEYSLTPLRCVHCASMEVSFDQAVNDAYCADCGQWQEDAR